jgi:RHS repeat-associated protein
VIPGINNTPQYNGNISAIKWSNNLDLASISERGYSFGYDPINRLTAATHQEKTTSWNASTSYHENNMSYDQNGNFISLNRNGSSGSNLDQLSYTYTGNQVQTITDAGDILNGFKDGNIGTTDYTYDANGNQLTDSNKGITSTTYSYLNQPTKIQLAAGSINYIYDAHGNRLSKTLYNSTGTLTKQTDYVGDFEYENDTLKFIRHEDGRVMMTGTTPEYQYEIRDNKDNVRVMFTTQPTPSISTATFETANLATEQNQFLRYDEVRMINCTLFDHTHNGVTSYSERLNGTSNEIYGLAKSMSVMPGDTIKLEVYDKYVDPTSSDWTAALATLLGQIVSGTAAAGTVIDGANYSTNGITPFPYVGLAGTGNSTGAGPKAYMNWLIFDKNYVFKNGGYVQMTSTAKEDGTNVPFEKLTASFTINEAGYVYVYLSNENPTPIEVHFDDFKVTQVKSPLIQANAYYPFGMDIPSLGFQREGSLKNRFLYNGRSELQDDFGMGVYYTPLRFEETDAPRWWQIDPKIDDYYDWTPYNYAFNNPITHNDPKGDCPPEDPGCVTEGATDVIAATVSDGLVGLYNLTLGPLTHTEASNESNGIFIEIGERQDPKTVTEAALKTVGNGLNAMSLLPTPTQTLGALAKTGAGVKTTVGNALKDVAKAEARAAKLSQVQRPGKDFTKAGKEAVKDLNKAKNDGKTVCVKCKTETIPGTKDKKGVKPPGNRTEVDHRKRKREGGSGTPDNGDVNCRDCNQAKH